MLSGKAASGPAGQINVSPRNFSLNLLKVILAGQMCPALVIRVKTNDFQSWAKCLNT